MQNPQQRFEAKVVKTDGCWEWRAGTRGGYGRLRVDGRKQTASRVAYALYKGPISQGLKVCHSCDNPKCVRPDHLFLGTQRQNVDDMIAKRRHIDGKRRGAENGNAKLTPEQVIAIRSDARSQSAIAASYGIGQAAVSKIKLRKLWRHL